MPKLSVIVPVYNTEKYLRECIDSILAQTFTDFELILVNDGSTDGSGAICDEYAKKDKRIQVIHQENSGVTYARKAGAIKAQGEYVTYVDSDDWIDTDTYGSLMHQINRHNADIGIFSMVLEKQPPTEIKNTVGTGFFSKEMLRQTVYPRMLFDYSQNGAALIASLCNKVIKRTLILEVISKISDHVDYGEDAIAAYVCILNASSIYVCNHSFYHYRDNLASISHARTDVMRKRILMLDQAMRCHFSGFDADMSGQIDGHITRHTVELVRAELLYATEKSFVNRISVADDFCKQQQIAAALKDAFPKICSKKEKIKVFLIRYRLFGLLYFLFRKV